MTLICLIAAVGLAVPASTQPAQIPAHQESPVRIARTPAPSPDGTELAFVYQGNIWKVGIDGGVATRLTANDCIDANPRWSPDGKWIAFNSDREGNNQVFLIPSQGGPARQITFHSVTSFVCDWFPDGKDLLVYSNRGVWRFGMFRLNVETGRLTPIVLDDLNLRYGSVSPDGKWIAFTRGALADLIRKGYRGAANYDIFVAPSDGSAPASRVTDSDRNDMYPAWGADSRSLFFASERAGIGSLWRQNRDGGRPTEVVANPPDAVRFVAGSQNGRVFAYECDNWIWVKPAEGPAKRLDIYCRTDDRGPKSRLATFSGNNVSEFDLSKDGKRSAFVIRGDLFVVTHDKGGEAKRLTDHPLRDEQPDWAPDGKSIVFASARNGDYDLMTVDLATTENKPLTTGAGNDRTPEFSPDGKWIAFLRSPETGLHLIRSDGTGHSVLVPGPKIEQFRWSADSKWIVFTREDDIRNTDLWVVSVDENGKGGAPINVTNHPGYNNSAEFLADGSKLIFRTNRYRNRDIETINHQGRYTLYSLPLVPEPVKFDVDEDVEKIEPPKDEKKPAEVKIDAKEIDRRAAPIVSLQDSIGSFAVSPDSKWVVFSAAPQNQNDLWLMSTSGGSLTRLNSGGGGGLQWAPDSSRIYYLNGGQIRWVNRSGQGSGSVGFTARMEVERLVDYLAVYDEAWQTMNELFYDKTFRGQDWRAIGAKYRVMVPEVRIRSDFNYLVTQLLAELNASHTGFSGGGSNAPPGRETGYLGIVEDMNHAGPGVRIAEVMPRSQADKDESRLHPGETILKVDGNAVSLGNALDQALNDKVGRTIALEVLGVDGKTRTMKFQPMPFGAVRALLYEKWYDERREIVEKASGGRLGYLHVNAMGDSQRNRFERELFSTGIQKEGMILDFRGNNGGDTHDSLLRILSRTKHYFHMAPRTETPFPQPERAYTKPTIVLMDEFSLSDAEVFANGYRELGLGKIVGNTTMGWIIFTSGRALIDGSFIRTPHLGCFTMDGRDMENWGVPPDVKVVYTPQAFVEKRDAILLRGVEELLKDGRLKG